MITIDFGNLALEIKHVGNAKRKCGDLLDTYTNKVKNKINSYSHKSSYTGAALDQVNYKIRQLTKKHGNLDDYHKKLERFKQETQDKETRLTNKIDSSFTLYGRKWNVKTDRNGFEKVLHSIGTAFLGEDGMKILGEIGHHIKVALKSAGKHLSDWWNYDGGKEWMDAFVAIGVAIVGVISAILAIVFAGPVIAIILAGAAAIFTVANAIAKISAYAKAGNSSHVLDKAVGNKLASNTTFSTLLRENGMYDLANAYDFAKGVVDALNFIYNAGEFLTGLKNLGNLKDIRLGENIINGLKKGFIPPGFSTLNNALNGGTTAMQALEFASKTAKVVNNYAKCAEGLYTMLTSNYFGKQGLDKTAAQLKNGKGLFDTLISNSLFNAFNQDSTKFNYMGGSINAKNTYSGHVAWSSNQGSFKPFNFISLGKDLHGVINTFSSVDAHSNLNSQNFQYNSNINENFKNNSFGKNWDKYSTPTKIISSIISNISSSNISPRMLAAAPPVISFSGGGVQF